MERKMVQKTFTKTSIAHAPKVVIQPAFGDEQIFSPRDIAYAEIRKLPSSRLSVIDAQIKNGPKGTVRKICPSIGEDFYTEDAEKDLQRIMSLDGTLNFRPAQNLKSGRRAIFNAEHGQLEPETEEGELAVFKTHEQQFYMLDVFDLPISWDEIHLYEEAVGRIEGQDNPALA